MAVTYDCVTEPPLEEIIAILRDPKNELVNMLPPVKPKEGDCYVFRTEAGSSKWFWRCDQYSWKNCNNWYLKDMGVRKTYFKAITAQFPNGDERFMKTEYSLTEESAGFVFVSYRGDSSIGEVTVHGNSRKSQRPHIRNAPIVKPKVIAEESRLEAPKALYNKLTDREFDFSNLFPNSKHVYCWIHLLDNVERWLKTNTFSTQEQRDRRFSWDKIRLKLVPIALLLLCFRCPMNVGCACDSMVSASSLSTRLISLTWQNT